MSDRISQSLSKLFERNRIVFWYDAKKELRGDFEAVQLDGVEKVEIDNNEFGLKYRILRLEPEKKILLYKEGPQPDNLENWVLDVQLYSEEFRTDQAALWLSELELGMEFAELTEVHAPFFQAAKRKDALKKLLKDNDTTRRIRINMLAVCAGSDPRLDSVLEYLLAELAEGKDEKYKLICRCKLDAFLWEEALKAYEYSSPNPGIKDFALRLFGDCFESGITPGKYEEIRKSDRLKRVSPSRMSAEAIVFLKRWKDSRPHGQAFEILSDQSAENLGIEHKLDGIALSQILELDYFRLIDQKILCDLIQSVTQSTMTPAEVENCIRQRRSGHWFDHFRHLYEAIAHAAQFIATLREANLEMSSFDEGIVRYVERWYPLDLMYRKFISHFRASNQPTLLESLCELIENLYTTNFLLKVNDAWQRHIDDLSRWESRAIDLQRNFYQQHIRHFVDRGKKVFVIISDGLRYEIAAELLALIRQEDRYEAELSPALSVLPSYTQLGMAALLPNKELSLAENETGTVFVDGMSSQGTVNRIKILQSTHTQSTAITADDLIGLNKDDARALVRDHDVVYIYQNRIDKTGHTRDTEERAFDAAEEAIQELIRMVKKLTGANASNLIITADHGFIYQHRHLENSDFSGKDASAETILFKDRRFVLGRNFDETPGLKTFRSQDLGLTGNIEVQIPKSINRLRQQGTGSRYVHGGASLQEVIIPILKINKRRQSDIEYVDVEIFRGASLLITSGQLAVTVYQVQPVTEKIQSRSLRLALFSLTTGEMISDSHELVFDYTSANSREREKQVQLLLSRKADAANGQEVILRLDEKITGTAHYKEYKSLRYTLRRSFTSDFD